MSVMNATTARLELLSAALHSFAKSLPRGAALAAAKELRRLAAELATHELDPAADAAVAGELARLLGALEGPRATVI